MIKPDRMSKLFVVGPRSKLGKVVSKLHDMKVAHIIEHKKEEFDICNPLENFEKTSSLLLQIRSLTTHLNISTDTQEVKQVKNIEENVAKIKEKVTKTIDEIKKTEDEISLTSEQKKILRSMAILGVCPEDFKKSNYIKSYLGYVEEPVKERLEKITDRFEIHTAEDKTPIKLFVDADYSEKFEIHATEEDKASIALFVDINYSEQFDKALVDVSFSETDTTVISSLKGDAMEIFEKLLKKHEDLKLALKTKKANLKKLAEQHGDFLASAEKFLSIETEQAQLPLSFGSTKEAFFMRCFVPEENLEHVKNEMNKAAENKLHMEQEPLGDEEDIPIKLKNSKYVKNFEFFTKVFALPKYSEFDPSILLAYTFPLFYGFMLGDVIYGLITFALFYYLKKKFPIGKDFFNMLLAASVSAIAFGFFYGEFGGLELYHFLIVRTHDFNVLMTISIIAGLVHVNFGLILGFILEYGRHYYSNV